MNTDFDTRDGNRSHGAFLPGADRKRKEVTISSQILQYAYR